MNRGRAFLLSAVAASLIASASPAFAGGTPSSAAPTASAPAGPSASTAAIQKIFDVRGLTPGQRDVVLQVLRAHDFDWSQMVLPSEVARRRIPFSVKDISAWEAAGLAWPGSGARIEIDDEITSSWAFRSVALHEVGHMVDFFFLEPKGLHDEVAAIYGKPWSEVAHSFEAAFTTAFTPFKIVDPTYPLNDGQIQQLRELLGGKGPAPSAGSVPSARIRPMAEAAPAPSVAGPQPARDVAVMAGN